MHRLSICGILFFGLGVATVMAQSNLHEQLSPSVQQRIEAFLRSKVELPTATILSFQLGPASDLPGFNKVSVHFTSSLTGTSGDIPLLISKDGLRIAQLSTYDIAGDPRTMVPSAGRPSRGGPPEAPVIVVVFDDLECPFCARLNQDLFPALASRYKKDVRVVYQNVPIEGHPWAMRAAVDTDCAGQLSPDAYWAAVDSIHEHAEVYGGAQHKLALAEQEIDAETLAEGHRFNVEEDKLKACIQKQDTTPEKASLALGEKFGVTHTPTVFVNGAKFEGAVPMDFVFEMVDNALRAEGKIPPRRQHAAKLDPTTNK